MAWHLKIVDVTWTEMHDEGEPPVPTEFDLSQSGRYRVDAEFGDSADPDIVLYENSYIFHKDKVNARAIVDDLSVNIGSTFPID